MVLLWVAGAVRLPVIISGCGGCFTNTCAIQECCKWPPQDASLEEGGVGSELWTRALVLAVLRVWAWTCPPLWASGPSSVEGRSSHDQAHFSGCSWSQRTPGWKRPLAAAMLRQDVRPLLRGWDSAGPCWGPAWSRGLSPLGTTEGSRRGSPGKPPSWAPRHFIKLVVRSPRATPRALVFTLQP